MTATGTTKTATKATRPRALVAALAPDDSDRDLAAAFRDCAAEHGLRLHRIHMLSATRGGAFQSTVVFDCACRRRWLLRVSQGDVVSVDGEVLGELKRGRDGQATAPPGFAGRA